MGPIPRPSLYCHPFFFYSIRDHHKRIDRGLMLLLPLSTAITG
uniref:Uncharacterized protein n=1 Tax=Vitis vinifera TaxID=29760 RepID=F6H4M5_VITVI